jgi:hypothetical protein
MPGVTVTCHGHSMVLGSTLRKECERPNASSLRIALVCSSLVEELRSQSQSRDQLPCPRERMKPAFLCRERMLLVTEFELFECFKKNVCICGDTLLSRSRSWSRYIYFSNASCGKAHKETCAVSSAYFGVASWHACTYLVPSKEISHMPLTRLVTQ